MHYIEYLIAKKIAAITERALAHLIMKILCTIYKYNMWSMRKHLTRDIFLGTGFIRWASYEFKPVEEVSYSDRLSSVKPQRNIIKQAKPNSRLTLATPIFGTRLKKICISIEIFIDNSHLHWSIEINQSQLLKHGDGLFRHKVTIHDLIFLVSSYIFERMDGWSDGLHG